MQTNSLNFLAEQFEVDRGTLAKAMRNVPPDFEKAKGRPQWKISTAARALEAYRRNSDRTIGGRSNHVCSTNNVDDDWQDPLLVRLYSDWDKAYTAMSKLKSLGERCRAAIRMAPMLARMDKMSRERGVENGNGEELTQLRADKLFQLELIGFEKCCSWSRSEVWKHVGTTGDVDVVG
jgi:hypothetical protein